MKKVKKKVTAKPMSIQVTEEDGVVKTIGKYFPDEKILRVNRTKSEHFMVKHNAWGLDAKVVDFLIQKGASVVIKEKETKWEFTSEAGNFKVYGILEEHKQHRPQYFLPVQYWEVARANNKSYILTCKETGCKYNFGKNCLRGVITIGESGECAEYEDRY